MEVGLGYGIEVEVFREGRRVGIVCGKEKKGVGVKVFVEMLCFILYRLF